MHRLNSTQKFLIAFFIVIIGVLSATVNDHFEGRRSWEYDEVRYVANELSAKGESDASIQAYVDRGFARVDRYAALSDFFYNSFNCIAGFLALFPLYSVLAAVCLRTNLRRKGYAWVTFFNALRLWWSVGSLAFRLPPRDEFEMLPNFQSTPRDLAQFARAIHAVKSQPQSPIAPGVDPL